MDFAEHSANPPISQSEARTDLIRLENVSPTKVKPAIGNLSSKND